MIPGSHYDFGTVTPPGPCHNEPWPGPALTPPENTSIQTGLRLMRAATIEDGPGPQARISWRLPRT